MQLCDVLCVAIIFINCLLSTATQNDELKQIRSCLSPDLEENERETCRFFAAVIDAGSTGTRLHLFEFTHEINHANAPFKLESETFKELKPGLSSFAKNPTFAAQHVSQLVEETRRVVPRHLWHHTPITLKATAGLRLLPVDESDEIISHVRDVIEESGFLIDIHSVGILDGTEEGVFGWFTLNFLLGRLRGEFGDGSKTAAAMDLGGGSTQITFVPTNLSNALGKLSRDDFSSSLKLFDQDVNLYTHSYLGNGLIAARLGVAQLTFVGHQGSELKTHCFPNGFVLNDWDYAGNLWTLRSSGKDSGFENCLKSTISFVETVNKVNEIQDLESRDIYMFSYFYDRGVQAGLSEQSPVIVEDYRKAAINGLSLYDFVFYCVIISACSIPAKGIGSAHWMPWQCFDLTYIYTLLRYGYRLPSTKNVQLVKRIKNKEVSWALGAAYHLLNEFHNDYKKTISTNKVVKENSVKSSHNWFEERLNARLLFIFEQMMHYISDKATHILAFFNLVS